MPPPCANTSPPSARAPARETTTEIKGRGQQVVALSPPGESHRTDRARLLAVLGISESEYVARFTSPTQTDWVMRCTPRKVLRTAEQEPVVLPPAKRAA